MKGDARSRRCAAHQRSASMPLLWGPGGGGPGSSFPWGHSVGCLGRGWGAVRSPPPTTNAAPSTYTHNMAERAAQSMFHMVFYWKFSYAGHAFLFAPCVRIATSQRIKMVLGNSFTESESAIPEQRYSSIEAIVKTRVYRFASLRR